MTGRHSVSETNHPDGCVSPSRRVLRWDGDIYPEEGDVEFRLTYVGELLATRGDDRKRQRALHVHDIRKHFHRQLRELWWTHPVLSRVVAFAASHPNDGDMMHTIHTSEGFRWLPMVTKENGLICKLEILMLRDRTPGNVLADIDNRLKTVFDALRLADSPNELGAKTEGGPVRPTPDEDPFYVLLQDDRLITHVAVTTDGLPGEVPNVPPENAARLVIDVTVRPYLVRTENLEYL